MKKILSLSILCIMLLTSACSSDSVTPMPDVNITVSTPSSAMSRAGSVSTPDGYKLHCIMQFLDANGAKVGTQKTADVSSSGTCSFTITGEEQESAKSAIFWAEYIKTDATTSDIYNTSDLTSVSYKTSAFDISNKAAVEACDAFCGTLSSIKSNTNVTLKRPFIRLKFAPSNPTVAKDATSLSVTYTTHTDYNVFTSTAKSTTELTLSNSSFSAEDTPWFAPFLLAPANQSKIPGDINISLNGGYQKSFTISKNDIPLDANTLITATGYLTANDVQIDISIDPDYSGTSDDNSSDSPEDNDDPNADDPTSEVSEISVGTLLKADGTVTTNSSEAVAIVFHCEATTNDTPAKYGNTFASKKIVGYATALTNIPATGSANYSNYCSNSAMVDLSDIDFNTPRSGIEWYKTLKEAENASAGNLFISINEWLPSHQLSGNSISSWFIPDLNQTTALINSITATDSKIADHISLHSLFRDNDSATNSNLFTSTCKTESESDVEKSKICVIKLNRTKNNDSYTYSAPDFSATINLNGGAICRMIFTVFADN